MYCLLWPMFTIWRFSASKTQPTVLWILKARYCQLRQKVLKTLEQLSCCEKPIPVVLGKVLKELKSNNSLISKLQPLGFLWTLRQMAPGVTEHFIWKHIRVVQEKITLIKSMCGNGHVWDGTYCWQFVRTTWLKHSMCTLTQFMCGTKMSCPVQHVLDICPLSISWNMQILCLGGTYRVWWSQYSTCMFFSSL